MNKIHRLVGEAIRFMFRANHIYILLAGLLNIGMGSYLIFNPKKVEEKLAIYQLAFSVK